MLMIVVTSLYFKVFGCFSYKILNLTPTWTKVMVTDEN